MAGKGNKVSDCKHASNPYHDCSAYCFDKKGESNRQKTTKPSGYGGDDAVKYNGDNKRTVRSGCSKASNPYHDCDEFCFSKSKTTQTVRPEAKRNSGLGVTDSTKLVEGMMGSRPKTSRELTVPLSSAVSSKPEVTEQHVSPEEKKDSRNVDYCEPFSEEICEVEDPSLAKDQNKFSQLVLVSGDVLKADKLQDCSAMLKKGIDSKPRESSEMVQIPAVHDKEEAPHATASPHTNGLQLPSIAHNLDETDDEEAKSTSSEPFQSIGKYRVKASFAPILQSIMDKQGDIAASCKLESSSIRSYYLECICYIVQELLRLKLPQISKGRVQELLAILKDVECAEIDVSWLRSVLDEVAEVVEFSSQSWTVETAKASYDREMELTKREMEIWMKDLTVKEKEIADAKAKVADKRARLRELELKYLQLNKTISSVQMKVDNLKWGTGRSLSDEVL